MPERDPLSAGAWWGRINALRKLRNEKLKTWQDSVSYRRLKPFKSTPAEDTVNVPADWSRTKNKASQLFYQVPQLVLRPRRPEYAAATSVFAAALNFQLTEHVHAEHMMNECLADLINAAGVMIAYVSYTGTFEDVQLDGAGGMGQPPMMPALSAGAMGVPTAPPPFPEGEQGPQGLEGGAVPPVPVVQGEIMPEGQGSGPAPITIPRPVYECYNADRISPAHFIWPVEFVGSDWQKASYLGREGYLPVAEAVRRQWVPEGTEGVQITDSEWLLVNEYNDLKPSDSFIKYVEVFFHPHTFDPNEKDPRKIQRVVLVEGKGGQSDQSKVVDEPFKWQKQDPQTGRWVGMTTYPIKVGTITHISDMAIPPSDSEAGRSQVREMIKSRSQMIKQRDHSMPLRWVDTNQVDSMIVAKLKKGQWQDMIPMNGPGDHAIGEVARAQYPNENWGFDKVISHDLDEAWSMGAMQQGVQSPGDTTATEVKEISGANDTRLDMERQWVMRFFLEVAMGVGQLMQMFSDDTEYAYLVGDDGVATLRQWNKNTIQGDYIFEAKPDSQLRVDVVQRRQEGLGLYKLLRKDPLIDPALLVRRVLEDHGLDPTKMIVKPQPPKPEKPKISASLKGEDMVNPIALALINKSDTPVTEADITAAKALIEGAAVPSPALPPPGGPGQPPPMGGVPAEHPGPPEPVQPLDRRYVTGGQDHGVAGSRDSGMPTPQK